MHSWATQMPEGMKLKSDGFASNLSAGSVPFTLEDFCKLTGRDYAPTDHPIPLEDFIAYGREFARRYVPALEELDVTSITRQCPNLQPTPDAPGCECAFLVTLENGDALLARHVILATGVSLFQYIPQDLCHLPKDMVTHTTAHRTFNHFAHHDVTVIGRGASSLNAAAILHEANARVTLLTRAHKIHVHQPKPAGQRRRSLYQRLRHPSSPLGDSLRSWLASNLPSLFKALPGPVRDLLVYKHLGPAGGTALHGRIKGKFPHLLGWSITEAELMDAPNPHDRRIKLILTNAELETREHITSHIIAGTGFRIDLRRYRFLADSLRSLVHCRKNGAPVLSHHFESSVKGLYFVGPVASNSFGPLLRFAAGSHFAARQVTERLVQTLATQRPSARPAFAPLPARTTID